MKARISIGIAVLCLASLAAADSFGSGANQFTIDFVTISGATNPTSGYGIVNNDYRMGVYEITNDQWTKFQAELGVPVTGTPSSAYDMAPSFTGINVPVSRMSWYEAAQFVNWLNTSTGHHAAYNFTGTQGTGDYAFDVWLPEEADGGTNLYRHKDAFYFLPTDGEWVKAAYWNGASLQTYAAVSGDVVHQGDGLTGTGWRYLTDSPWDVGSGSEELNGTFDMMGNGWEWMESPYYANDYGSSSFRAVRGGSYSDDVDYLASVSRAYDYPNNEGFSVGLRVASNVPEPATVSLLALGGVAVLKRRQRE